MDWVTTGLLLLGLIFALILTFFIGKKSATRVGDEYVPDVLSLYKDIKELPARVLATIQGSINPQKGKIAELLTYAQLRYEYDVIIPLGKPVDFIGIRLRDRIDFIEVKSGQAVLSAEEHAISQLVTAGKVHFRLVVVRDEQLRGLLEDNEMIISHPLPQG